MAECFMFSNRESIMKDQITSLMFCKLVVQRALAINGATL